MKSLFHQRGVSSIALLLTLLVGMFFANCAIKLLPEYMESRAVRASVEEFLKEPGATAMSRTQIRDRLLKLFTVNRVKGIKASEVKVSVDQGKLVIDANYEKRLPLMLNIDVVLKFDNLIFKKQK